MRKILILLVIVVFTSLASMAAKMPADVVEYIKTNVPGADVRFDGVVIFPDNTVYLPLFPSLFSDINVLKIKESIPENQALGQRPNVVIFNNDFVLLKVLPAENGKKTVLHMSNPPLQVRTGLLPQEMLVPSGLIIPENLKGIIGNLNIDVKKEDIIKQNVRESFEEFLTERNKIGSQSVISQLNGKKVYISTNYSKNIQVLDPAKSSPEYSLAQRSIPVNIELVNDGKFMLVTSYQRQYVDVISIADSRYIKQIALGTNPEEIVIDEENNLAYVTAPSASVIIVLDLSDMSIKQKIRVNGYCEKLLPAGDKIFYVDKRKGAVWAIEIDNNYALRNVGTFPNASALMFANNKLYVSSRTKSRVAVIDYETLGLESEFSVANKPVGMLMYNGLIYLLSAQNNVIQCIDVNSGSIVKEIKLVTDGFSARLSRISGTNLAVVADVKTNSYSIIDLDKGVLLKTYYVNVPIKDVKITKRVNLFD